MNVSFSTSFQFVRSRFYNPIFLMVLLFSVLAYIMIWVLSPFGGLWPSILVTGLVSSILLLQIFSAPMPWKSRGELLWAVPFMVSIVLVLFGDKTDRGFIAGSGALLFIALPFWWIFWHLSGRQWVLSTGLILAGGMTMVYWSFSPLWGASSNSASLLAPLPFVALAGIGWAAFAYPVLRLARRWKYKRVRGRAWRLAALVLWFAPAAGVGSVGPPLLGLDPIWSAVSLTVVGVVLSAVVSDSLRFLLLEWSGLS